jgi:hypothetical protein
MAKAAITIIGQVSLRDSLCNSSAKGIIGPVVFAINKTQPLTEIIPIYSTE